MNNYYIDSNVSVSGNGSYDAPFKDLSDFLALASVTHPITVNIKRGSFIKGTYSDTNGLLLNTTEEMSYFQSYGYGPAPKIIQGTPLTITLNFNGVRKFIFQDLDFILTDVSKFANIRVSNTSTSTDGDVWLNNIDIRCLGNTSVDQASQNAAVILYVSSTDALGTNKFGVTNCRFDNLNRALQLWGTKYRPDINDNSKTLYSYGLQIKGCSFTRIVRDCAFIGNADSKQDPRNGTDEYTSAIYDSHHSGYRWDKQSSDNNSSVAFWCYESRRVHFKGLVGFAQYPTATDKTLLDFDLVTRFCLFEHCYSSNHGGGLFITSSWSNQADYELKDTTTYNAKEWYYTREWGSQGNTIRYCLSFNDGKVRKGILQGQVFNMEITNCTFIDTISKNVPMDLFTIWKIESTPAWNVDPNGDVKGFIVSNCNVYSPFSTGINLIKSDSNADSTTPGWWSQFNNCNFFSGGNAITYKSHSDQGNNTVTDPQYLYVPISNPSSITQAALLTVSSVSPLINSGVLNSSPDILGNTGNTIGWLQY